MCFGAPSEDATAIAAKIPWDPQDQLCRVARGKLCRFSCQECHFPHDATTPGMESGDARSRFDHAWGDVDRCLANDGQIWAQVEKVCREFGHICPNLLRMRPHISAQPSRHLVVSGRSSANMGQIRIKPFLALDSGEQWRAATYILRRGGTDSHGSKASETVKGRDHRRGQDTFSHPTSPRQVVPPQTMGLPQVSLWPHAIKIIRKPFR